MSILTNTRVLTLITALFISLIGPVSWAQSLSDIESQLLQAANLQNQIVQRLEPGFVYKDRLQVSTDQTQTIQQLQSEFNSSLKNAKDQLALALFLQRSSQNRIPQTDYDRYRRSLEAFNSLLTNSQQKTLIYKNKNWLHGFGTLSPLGQKDIKPLKITKFDFTSGFAYECRSEWASGITVYRNSVTGEIQWIDEWKSGVAITGMNSDGSAHVESRWKTGISSAYNPLKGIWEKAEGSWKTPIASVYNPRTQTVEHKTGSWRTGIAGVYNPLTGQAEWKQEWSSGVAGYFDPNEKKVKWESTWKSGVACIWRDQKDQYFTSSSFFGGEVDDED